MPVGQMHGKITEAAESEAILLQTGWLKLAFVKRDFGQTNK
jgi:hypothetical protein